MTSAGKMFSFFHRTPTIHLDCFTSNSTAFDYTPVVKASKTIPDWWKKVDRSSTNFNFETLQHPVKNTVKTCYGFLELYNKGVVIENWTDLIVNVTEDNYKFFCSNGRQPVSHPREQIGSGFKNYHHMKHLSPWFFREKTGVQFLSIGAEWALEDYRFKILPGVVNYNINNSTNANIMIPATKHEFKIGIGHPLLHIIPLSEKKVEFKNHLVSDIDMLKITDCTKSFWGWRAFDSLNNRNKERNGKCPFGFGE